MNRPRLLMQRLPVRRTSLYLLIGGLLLAPFYMSPSAGLLDEGGNDPSTPIPEPGTFILVGCGLILLAILLRRRRRVGFAG